MLEQMQPTQADKSIPPSIGPHHVSLRCAVRDPAPPAQQVLYNFADAADLARWRVFSDQELGGKSEAHLDQWPEHPVRRVRPTRGAPPSPQLLTISMLRKRRAIPARAVCDVVRCDCCASQSESSAFYGHWRVRSLDNHRAPALA